MTTPKPLPLSPEAAALKPPTLKSGAPQPEGKPQATPVVAETGGPKGPEPTRFGDWERKGRCSDF